MSYWLRLEARSRRGQIASRRQSVEGIPNLESRTTTDGDLGEVPSCNFQAQQNDQVQSYPGPWFRHSWSMPTNPEELSYL